MRISDWSSDVCSSDLDPFQHLPGQVQPVEFRVVSLQQHENAQRLVIMVEAAIRLHDLVQRLLPRMAEWGVAEIVGKRQRFGQILVELEAARQRSEEHTSELQSLMRT